MQDDQIFSVSDSRTRREINRNIDALIENVDRIIDANRPWLPGSRRAYQAATTNILEDLRVEAEILRSRVTDSTNTRNSLRGEIQTLEDKVSVLRKDIKHLRGEKIEHANGDLSKLNYEELMDLEEQIAVEKQIRTTERKITELQRARPDSKSSSSTSTPRREDYTTNSAYLLALGAVVATDTGSSSRSDSGSSGSSDGGYSSSSSSFSSDSGSSFSSGGFDGGGGGF